MRSICKTLLLASLWSLCSIFWIGCEFDDDSDCIDGSGDILTEIFNVSTFDEISIKVFADIRITQGDTTTVKVEGQENLLDLLDVTVEGDRLEIDFDGCVSKVNNFDISITTPNINTIDLAGSGDIVGTNTFITDELEVRLGGSGDIDLEVEANEIEIALAGSGDIVLDVDVNKVDADLAGSGEINLKGITNDYEIDIAGSGDVESFDLDSEDCKVRIAGSGDAEVNVSDELDVTIIGSGNVYFKGNPNISSTITGSGRLIDRN